MWIAAGLTVYTGFLHFRAGLRHLHLPIGVTVPGRREAAREAPLFRLGPAENRQERGRESSRPQHVVTVGRSRCGISQQRARRRLRRGRFADLKRLRAAVDQGTCGFRRTGRSRRRKRGRVLSAGDGRMTTIRIQREDFDIGDGSRLRSQTAGKADVGAVVTFTGHVRGDGEPLSALTLEHYPGMTEREIASHVRRSGARRWPLTRRDDHPSHRAGSSPARASCFGRNLVKPPPGQHSPQRNS